MHPSPKSVGLVGARGYVGQDLIPLLAAHAGFELAWMVSRSEAGTPVSNVIPAAPSRLTFEALTPADVGGRPVDVCVLALPNAKAAPWVAALRQASPETVIVDLSADYRFDDNWYYGLPELTRQNYTGQTQIANPGCYATGMQLALAPIVSMLATPPVVFGVSGYSGAGTTPSPRNDPARLKDNLLPYSLINHLHEREVSRQLQTPVHFLPHVAPFFRGISLSIDVTLKQPLTQSQVMALYVKRYADEPLVAVTTEAPEVTAAAGQHGATIGGFTSSDDGLRLAFNATLDNLLKGAATQALQNLNLACGFNELEGIAHG